MLSPASPALAQVAASDPVVVDVVRMLDAGIEPGLVQSWLDSSGARAGILSADDMIALAAAEAPAELVEALLDRSARAAPAAIAAKTPSQPPVSLPDPANTDAPAPAAAGSSDCCLVDFSVEYRSAEDSDGNEMAAAAPDLFLYVDGRLLGRFESRGDIASRGPLTFRQPLPPGMHSIRLTREMHTPSKNRGRSDTWDHVTTVSPDVIRFEVKPGVSWNLDIRWAESVFSLKPPLHWRWSGNGVQVAGEENVGASRDDWSYLCDDVEISRESGAISDWRATDRSKQCVTWASLWAKDVMTTRARILDELRADRFKPDIGTTGRTR